MAAEAVKQLPKLHIDYDAGTMTFNDENIDLNPNLSEVAKNIKSIQKFFSGMDYFYGVSAVFRIEEQLRYEAVPDVRRYIRRLKRRQDDIYKISCQTHVR